jgi:hypothetical protein
VTGLSDLDQRESLADSQIGVTRWNRISEIRELDFRFALSRSGFHQEVGRPVLRSRREHGKITSRVVSASNSGSWAPSDDDVQF